MCVFLPSTAGALDARHICTGTEEQESGTYTACRLGRSKDVYRSGRHIYIYTYVQIQGHIYIYLYLCIQGYVCRYMIQGSVQLPKNPKYYSLSALDAQLCSHWRNAGQPDEDNRQIATA